jgi:hypothetical protein
MMSEELETARRYRLHARELRLIAEGMEDGPDRLKVVQVAEDYEKMAASLEALHRSSGGTTSGLHHSAI